MPFDSHPLDVIKRNISALAMASIALTSVAVFTLTGAVGYSIQEWEDDQSTTVMSLSGSYLTGATLSMRGTMSGNTAVVSNTTAGSLTGTDLCVSTGSNTICACGSCD